MNIIIPRWRGDADHVFVSDSSGNIIRVVYPSGDGFLRCGADD